LDNEVMDAKTLDVLEWQALKDLLATQASHALGRDRCGAIAIETHLDTVSQNLRLTGEASELLQIAGGMPTGGILDIRHPLKRAKAGAMLASDELLAIANTLKGGKRLKDFLAERKEDFPALWELGEPIAGLGELALEIEKSFDQAGEVADSASAELAAIRRKLRELQARVRQTLQRIISQQASALQDPIITLRGDRYVLPVRADAKSQVAGIVHDQSATGATLYIEPMAVLELNNSLKQAQLQERAEVERILFALSAAVAERHESLSGNIEALGELEFTQAKGRLARLMDASCPRLSRDGRIKLYKARHPLLVHRLGAATVPIDVSVGDEHQVLLITGPNTGGKTVTLKTLGLCVLMTQAGLYPPVAPGSHVGLMRSVFADIGDEQSLEQSLSTFSGHLKNIIRILSHADDRTLVLFDELGAGTDPAEGAALGRAIVETLMAKGAKVVATLRGTQAVAL
jgi:DNA mismatch repair protein MutS2